MLERLMSCCAARCAACGASRPDTRNLGRLLAAFAAIQKSIKTEAHCPHVGGIKVKPTYFYVFLGYIASAIVALVVKAGVTA